MKLQGVFEGVEKACRDEDRLNPYLVISKYVILDDMDGLVGAVKHWLRDGPAPHLLRCLTHLLLLLRKSSVLIETSHLDALNEVLHACIKVPTSVDIAWAKACVL